MVDYIVFLRFCFGSKADTQIRAMKGGISFSRCIDCEDRRVWSIYHKPQQ